MLFLDRIEILGFKSFCDKTILKIPDGITAIIGPNGCGKSNVVDALNWVLGEQSAKSLRSDKMEEVIFNGSKNRKPLSMAQVMLIWKADRMDPHAPEITIGRRLFRSGESQYEMNGDICRLKDIHSFFINEGFDPLAYSILEQGKIEALFLSKPHERRHLIEEVAGVAEFKQKKRAAQLKLADNQIQLERVQDILNEVQKQLSSLKRQAAKTRRYQVLRQEEQAIHHVLYERKFRHMKSEQTRLGTMWQECSSSEQEAARVLQQQELIFSEMKLRFAGLENQIYHDQSYLHQLEMQIQENQNSLQSRRQRVTDLQGSIADKQSESQKFQEEELRFQSELSEKMAAESNLHVEIDGLTQHHTQLYSEWEAAGNEVTLLEQKVQDLRKEILDLLSQSSLLKSEQARLYAQQDHLAETISRKETERSSTGEALRRVMEGWETKENSLRQVVEEIGYLNQTQEEILQRCEHLKTEWDDLQPQVQAAFKQQSEVQNALHKLDAQQHSSKFYNESARSLLNQPSREALGMMMDFIETEPQYETAIENFLADKLNYLIVQSEDSALNSIDYLKQQGLGYCGFVIKNGHDLRPPVLPFELQQEQGVIGTLREVVRIREEALPAVAPFMQTAVMVSDLESAKGLIKKYPDYQYVTVQGDVILSPAIYAGGAKADDVPGLIAIQREIRESSVELNQVEERLHQLDEQVRSVQDRLDISNRELVRVNEVRESKNKDRMMIQMELDQLGKEREREERLMDILTQEIERFMSEREAVQARSEDFARQLENATKLREEKEREFQTSEESLASAKESQTGLQSRVQESRIQIAEKKERDRALQADLERVRAALESLRLSLEENRNLIEQKYQEISETEKVISDLEHLLVETLRAQDEQKKVLRERQQQKEEMTGELSRQEETMQGSRSELGRIREERMQLEVEKTRIDTQMEDLIARCREEMGMEIGDLNPPESEWTQMQDEELRLKLSETEMKIERLGSINMLALEEYQELEERHRFLQGQYDDLKVSIETLLETIRRIDVTSLQRFKEAFDGVQAHFQNLFQRLFNGGKAEMVLVDPENPNESGIEIHVQPPGKRLQNMNLLSGGEKSLTGVAFLMALFQYHASPFCVMDEVDAALDEANVGRFTALLRDMKQQIQFITVTHNKRTMESADQLYGVTMAEPGVSTVLSARFDEAEALIEA